MSGHLFLLPTLMLWAVIPNVTLKYILVEVKELTKHDVNKGIIYSTTRKHINCESYYLQQLIFLLNAFLLKGPLGIIASNNYGPMMEGEKRTFQIDKTKKKDCKLPGQGVIDIDYQKTIALLRI